MKKSRIIIPALAMIAFSVAASISGAVAWFTANRTANIEAGNYTVVKTSSNLSVTLADGIGTQINNSTGVVTVNNKLTDGSVEHRTDSTANPAISPKIYTPNETKTAIESSVGVEAAVANDLFRGKDSSNADIYTAVTFGMTFEIEFGSAQKDIGLFLDCTADHSRFELAGDSVGAQAKTAKGFRVALIPTAASTNGRAVVFADLQESAKCKHVADGNFAGVAYSGDLCDSAYSTALPTSGNLASYTGRADYLGKFAYPAANAASMKVQLAFTVVCWFEGTDEEIVNRASDEEYQTVKSYLHFEAIDLPAAA